MKRLLKLLALVAAVLGVAVLALLLTGNAHILYGLPSTYFSGKTRPDIDDFAYHTVRTVSAGEPQPWAESKLADSALETADQNFLDSLESAAFLVVCRDTLIYEWYGEGCHESALINSFSMAKSFTSMAIGAAVDRGAIALDEPVATYLPRFNEGQSARMTVRHVLQMRSGIDFGESYANPFGYQAKAYFGKDLWGITAPYRASQEPGTEWKYEGGNTVLLNEVLTASTGDVLSEAFSRDVWQRIGAEADAHWAIDNEGGHERAFSAFFATARDFARIGRLMLHKGQWNGKTLLSEAWVDASLSPVGVPDMDGKAIENYGFQWWLAPKEMRPWHFSARGMRGQYIVVVPDEELVIVRLGSKRIEAQTEQGMTPDLPRWIAMGVKLKNSYAQRH